MSKRCAVPGCSTGDPEEIKKRKLLQEKLVYLFGAPKAAVKAWSTTIEVTTPLTTKNVVYQYHFAAEDIITHFVHPMPDETVVFIERERYVLRKDAYPVAGAIREMPQSLKILDQWSGSTMSEAMAIESTSEAVDNASTRQALDNDCRSRGLADSHDNSDFDSDKDMTSLMTDAVVSYSMENLMTDLTASQRRESWAWSRNVKEIVLVYLTPLTLESTVYLSVKNDLTVTVSLADRKSQVQVDAVRTFTDLTTMLGALEKMKESVGTGQTKQTYVNLSNLFVFFISHRESFGFVKKYKASFYK